jgi:hypothetical protein
MVWVALGPEGFSSVIAKWRAERWLNSTYEDVLEITDDERLVETHEPEVTVSGTLRCVRAGASHVFGTDRSYDEVVEDYTSWLREKGWRMGDIPEDAETNITHIFYIPDNNYSRTLEIAPYQPEEPVNFETVYKVVLYFTEFRCGDACPPWRCPG